MTSTPIESGDDATYVAKFVVIEEAMDCLWRAYRELPECSKHVLLLHRLGGVPQEEVAVQLGVDLCAIERDLAVAIERLQRALFCTRKHGNIARPD